MFQSEDLSEFVNTSLVDRLVKKIRTNIYTGKYPAGKKLIVRELSEEFCVSHTPIKDALNRLVAEGYVEAPPRKSMVVRTYTNAEIIDALLARLMCEIFCADVIIEQAGKHPEIVEEMQDLLKIMQDMLSDYSHLEHENWVKSETSFHRCYMKYCGDAQIYRFYKELDTNKTTYFAYLDANHSPLKQSTLECNLIEHRAIADAIAALDTKRLINAVIRHITRACDDYATDEECKNKLNRLLQIRARYET